LNFDVWILKAKNSILKFLCEILKTKMFELGCVNKLKFEFWIFYVKPLEFENLKTEMFEFGCVNIESWKLKTNRTPHHKQPHCTNQLVLAMH